MELDINVLKEISWPEIEPPRDRKISVTIEFIFNISLQITDEKLIHIAIIKVLVRNW